jgi:hypothetical protein
VILRRLFPFLTMRLLQLKPLREAERAREIAAGNVPDEAPGAQRMRLEDAITLVGTCLDMCPEFEREERDYQGEADVFERVSRVYVLSCCF